MPSLQHSAVSTSQSPDAIRRLRRAHQILDDIVAGITPASTEACDRVWKLVVDATVDIKDHRREAGRRMWPSLEALKARSA